MFVTHIKNVMKGIESGQEDSLKFSDFLSCHVDSVNVMVTTDT